MRTDKKSAKRNDKRAASHGHKQGAVGYSKKSALLEDAITQMNAGKYARSSAALKELLALDPLNMEARRLFATLHLRLGSLIPARQAFDSLVNEAFERQDYWLAESLLREYLAAGPRCVPFLEKLGTIYQDKGDALAAVAEYGKAIDILLEDPDPDHPQLAAQLYAKVRELAPASPVAFRLASFFDAQSGELIVSTKPEAGGAVPASVEAAEAAAPALDSPTDFSHLEQASERLESLPQDSTLPADASVVQSGEAPSATGNESASVQHDQSPPDPLPVESPEFAYATPDMPSEAPADAVRNSETTTETLDQPADSPAVQEPPSLELPGSEAVHEVQFPSDPTVSALQSEPPIDRTGDSAAPSSVETSPAAVLDGPEQAGPSESESLSAPMPWEQVEHSIVTIPEPEVDTTVQSSMAPESPVSGPGFTAMDQEPAPPAEAPVPDLMGVATETERLDSQREEPPPSQTSDIAPANNQAETAKHGGISWESIFSGAWPFGGSSSNLDGRDETPNVEIAPAAASGQAGDVSEPVVIPDADRMRGDRPLQSGAESGAASISEPGPAPMPWDQVQDATIRIQPQETEPQPVVETVEQGDPPAAAVEEKVPFESGVSETAPSVVDHVTAPPVAESQTLSYSDSASPAAATEIQFVGNSPEPSGERSAAPFSFSESREEPLAPAASPASESVSVADAGFEAAPEQQPAQLAPHESSIRPIEALIDVPPTAAPEPASVQPMPVSSAEPPPASPQPAHWETGQVAVQTHRPSRGKRKRSSAPAPEPPPVEPASAPHDEPAHVESPVQTQESVPDREDWMHTGEAIRFVESPVSTGARPVFTTPVQENPAPPPLPAAASAVDVLFQSTGRTAPITTHARTVFRSGFRLRALLSRIRIGLVVFLRSCFSTTRAIATTATAFVVLMAAVATLGLGAAGMAWLVMEEQPTPAFNHLTTVPQRTVLDAKRNGYLLLLGFDAPSWFDPVQAGYERKPDGRDTESTAGCVGGGPDAGSVRTASGPGRGWYRTADPVAQFRLNQGQVKDWWSKNESAIGRYKQWLGMGFDDWGYGQSISPPCEAILAAHRMYVADGFAQGQDVRSGVDRLEADLEAWRTVLGQAKTLSVKMMAVQAITDDAAAASGLLARPDTEGVTPDRVARMLRPLDQMELSLRWPMQSQFVTAARTFDAQLKTARTTAPWYGQIVSTLPLPKQRRFNEYARYYEDSYKAAGEGRFGSLPKRVHYIHVPAVSAMDVLRNPIDNLIGLEPLPAWDLYTGLVVDADARLRLASLQVWLRRSPQGADLMAQIAKAGQGLYDPFTGYPMLVNLSKGLLYSVGRDGQDQDGHPQTDIAVAIPPGLTFTARSAAGAPRPR